MIQREFYDDDLYDKKAIYKYIFYSFFLIIFFTQYVHKTSFSSNLQL